MPQMRFIRVYSVGMIVCVCHRVSDRDIARLAQHGVSELAALQACTGLGSTCGRCKDCAQMVLEECHLPGGPLSATLAPGLASRQSRLDAQPAHQ